MSKLKSTIIGAFGEYYVAAYLSSMGLIVALPRGGIPTTDIIVTTETGGRSLSLQIKTGTSSHKTYKTKPENNYWLWDTGLKALKISDDMFWYAYVYTNGWPESGKSPEVFFVPSSKVADCIRQSQKESKRPFFWMYETEAEEYRGLVGCKKLMKLLTTTNK